MTVAAQVSRVYAIGCAAPNSTFHAQIVRIGPIAITTRMSPSAKPNLNIKFLFNNNATSLQHSSFVVNRKKTPRFWGFLSNTFVYFLLTSNALAKEPNVSAKCFA
jgi:hypothetical protein